MSLKRRGKKGVWWVRFTAPNGKRVFQSAKTTNRRQAEEYEARLINELWRVHKLGDKPRYTWQQAVVRWIEEQRDKATLDDDIAHLRWLDKYFGDLCLDQVDRPMIDRITLERMNEGVSNATVNRLLQVVRAILRRAQREWEWVDRIPVVRLLKEDNRRVRWLTVDEADCLLNELLPHIRDMASFALATGLRESNVTGLEWSQVDLQRKVAWIHPDQAKARKAISVPLNCDALSVLRLQLGRHPVRVFTYKGRPVKKVGSTKSWRKALDRAGIRPYDDGLHLGDAKKRYPTRSPDEYKYTDFRWHDLRHTWASWHVQAGTPLHALQELGGWASPEMVQRYAHLSAGHLANYADNIGGQRTTGAKLVAISDRTKKAASA
jgi:integrase